MQCFLFQKEYLQVELPYLADIRKIVTEGNVTSYSLRVSKDGIKFRYYNASGKSKHLVGTMFIHCLKFSLSLFF